MSTQNRVLRCSQLSRLSYPLANLGAEAKSRRRPAGFTALALFVSLFASVFFTTANLLLVSRGHHLLLQSIAHKGEKKKTWKKNPANDIYIYYTFCNGRGLGKSSFQLLPLCIATAENRTCRAGSVSATVAGKKESCYSTCSTNSLLVRPEKGCGLITTGKGCWRNFLCHVRRDIKRAEAERRRRLHSPTSWQFLKLPLAGAARS